LRPTGTPGRRPETLAAGPGGAVRLTGGDASRAEQAQLEQVARQGRTPQKVACRARIVLMLANHEPPSSVAVDLGISRMTVRLWADRFLADGIPGLAVSSASPRRPPARVQD